MYVVGPPYQNELWHHGILGQKWGVRRFQNADGTLTTAGKERYGVKLSKNEKQTQKEISKAAREIKRNRTKFGYNEIEAKKEIVNKIKDSELIQSRTKPVSAAFTKMNEFEKVAQEEFDKFRADMLADTKWMDKQARELSNDSENSYNYYRNMEDANAEAVMCKRYMKENREKYRTVYQTDKAARKAFFNYVDTLVDTAHSIKFSKKDRQSTFSIVEAALEAATDSSVPVQSNRVWFTAFDKEEEHL